jgi:hypothetical protein
MVLPAYHHRRLAVANFAGERLARGVAASAASTSAIQPPLPVQFRNQKRSTSPSIDRVVGFGDSPYLPDDLILVHRPLVQFELLGPPSGSRHMVVPLRSLTTKSPIEASPMRVPVEGNIRRILTLGFGHCCRAGLDGLHKLHHGTLV